MWTRLPLLIPKPLRWTIFWTVAIGGLGALDAWRATKHDGSTLSEQARVLFMVDEPEGRAVFLALLDAGSVALANHIIKQVEQ